MFIPQYGMTAAAATTLIGYIVIAVITYHFSEKFYPCDYGIVRVVINMAVMYVISIAGADLSFGLRIGLTAVCIIGTLFMFRERLLDVYYMFKEEKQ